MDDFGSCSRDFSRAQLRMIKSTWPNGIYCDSVPGQVVYEDYVAVIAAMRGTPDEGTCFISV